MVKSNAGRIGCRSCFFTLKVSSCVWLCANKIKMSLRMYTNPSKENMFRVDGWFIPTTLLIFFQISVYSESEVLTKATNEISFESTNYSTSQHFQWQPVWGPWWGRASWKGSGRPPCHWKIFLHSLMNSLQNCFPIFKWFHSLFNYVLDRKHLSLSFLALQMKATVFPGFRFFFLVFW